MNRLTIKDKAIRDNFNAEYAKLADLEDIEEEIGIDLITLFKAVMNGFWWKSPLGFHYVNEYEYVIDLEESRLIQLYEENSSIFYFEDYGKVWALTKEELEEERK